ncbi:hypothetical protein [Spongiimicrobium salis]|uniref:hypothetical protein n=1 Tax=Spongiimicrobium salis TaxID=1667022 RepID=UPI00374D72A2
MDFENLNIGYWIILAVVGILCGILGYLWGKGKSTTIDHSEELTSLKNKNSKLLADLEACTQKLNTATETPETILSSLDDTDNLPTFNAGAAKAAFGKTIKENDLKIVEGIGPKIESLFYNFDIKTWKDLSEVSVAKCQEVLDSGGSRYRIHDPSSWPMQAKMCYQGKWKDLVKWQDKHNSGKF